MSPKYSIDSLLSNWDGQNIIVQYDSPTGSWFIIAIHSTRLGAALGGTRMRTYPNWEEAVLDALNLSKSMTYKLAIADLPRGGGKGVIAIPKNLLEIGFGETTQPSVERTGEIERLVQNLGVQDLPDETLWALFCYYERTGAYGKADDAILKMAGRPHLYANIHPELVAFYERLLTPLQ